VLARAPWASGFLSGNTAPDRPPDPDDIRSRRDPAVVEERLQQVQEIQRTEVLAA
jgi:hypothetical protein